MKVIDGGDYTLLADYREEDIMGKTEQRVWSIEGIRFNSLRS